MSWPLSIFDHVPPCAQKLDTIETLMFFVIKIKNQNSNYLVTSNYNRHTLTIEHHITTKFNYENQKTHNRINQNSFFPFKFINIKIIIK